ncbi:MAG: M48 family metallopeptidase [Verrucomicrobiota bacterium]
MRAKRYEAIHNVLFLVETALTLALLLAFLFTNASNYLAATCQSLAGNPWLNVALYGAAVVIATKLVFLPLNWFGDYYLEHRYELSNETFGGWALDELKSLGLNLLMSVLVLNVIYFCLRRTGDAWWLWASGAVLLMGVVMSALFPVLILPLFYKLVPLENESLKQKLVALAQRVGANVLGVYRMSMSDKTKKANAAFAGLGATKRIILGDTLLTEFAEDEIEVVMAHEMAHYKHGDIGKMIGVSAVTTVAGFWICDLVFWFGLQRLGFTDRADLGAFPVLALGLFGFGLLSMPVNNAFSRWRERKADRTALDLTRNPDGFIRAMRKLADQNLADLSPHPVIEFFLHDHPSLESRIALAQEWQPN